MSDRPPRPLGASAPRSAETRLEETQTLLHRAADGDAGALEALCTRYLPRLRSWATRRLPDSARYRMDTDDLVQEVMVGTIRNLEGLEQKHAPAFLSYLRQGVMRRVISEVRNARLRHEHAETEIAEAAATPRFAASPLDELVGHETLERYERALERLTPEQQDLVIARVELGFAYKEIALHTGRPSPDAVRMACRRSLLTLAQEMGRDE